MENTKKLTGKDLINVGIYTAMTLVIFFVVGLLTALPVVYPFLFIIWPIVCGIPMMLYYTKIQKFGMLTITGIIGGIFFYLMRLWLDRPARWVLGGILSDVVLKSAAIRIQGHCSELCLLLPWHHGLPRQSLVCRRSVLGKHPHLHGRSVRKHLAIPDASWMLYVGFALLFVGGILGALLGHKMLKKHFERAGIV